MAKIGQNTVSTIFEDDWYEGRENAFTTSDEFKKIGWEVGLNALCNFLYNDKEFDNLLKSALMRRQEFTNIAQAMDVNANIILNQEDNSAYTDGSKIVIGKKFIPSITQKTSMTIQREKLDLAIAMLIHECCHCKYTDFKYMEANRNKVNNIIHQIANILEDESIERNIGLNFPGYVNFLAKLKTMFFSRKYRRYTLNVKTVFGEDDLTDIFNILLFVIRYPEYLAKVPIKILKKYDNLFKKIKNVLNINNLLGKKFQADCTIRTLKSAIAIYNILVDEGYIKDDKDANKSMNSSLLGKIPSSNIGSSSSDNSGAGSSDNNSDDNGQDDSTNNSGNSDNSDNSDNYNNDEINDILDELDNVLMSSSEANTNSEVYKRETEILAKANEAGERTNKKTKNNGLTEDSDEDTDDDDDTFGWGGDAYETLDEDTAKKFSLSMYRQFYGDINKYIEEFKKIVIPNSKTESFHKIDNQRTGQLDPNMLVSALLGKRFVNTKFQRKVVKDNPKYAFVLLIDESGSMGKPIYSKYNSKFPSPAFTASKLAVLFYEALKNYPELKLFIYGHSEGVIEYITPNTMKNYNTLGCRHEGMNQNDALAIKTTLEAVRQQTNLPIVFVNITDALYLATNDEMKQIINDNPTVLFSLLCIGNMYAYVRQQDIERFSKLNDELYGEGNWLNVATYKKDNNINENFKKLAEDFAKILNKLYMKK